MKRSRSAQELLIKSFSTHRHYVQLHKGHLYA